MPANVCERTAPHAVGRCIGWRWPALAGSGAGDGNRKYRWRALAFWNHEVASATGAAYDFCVKNDAIRANASQCGHWSLGRGACKAPKLKG